MSEGRASILKSEAQVRIQIWSCHQGCDSWQVTKGFHAEKKVKSVHAQWVHSSPFPLGSCLVCPSPNPGRAFRVRVLGCTPASVRISSKSLRFQGPKRCPEPQTLDSRQRAIPAFSEVLRAESFSRIKALAASSVLLCFPNQFKATYRRAVLKPI